MNRFTWGPTRGLRIVQRAFMVAAVINVAFGAVRVVQGTRFAAETFPLTFLTVGLFILLAHHLGRLSVRARNLAVLWSVVGIVLAVEGISIADSRFMMFVALTPIYAVTLWVLLGDPATRRTFADARKPTSP